MAVQPIRLFGDPILRTPCREVVAFDRNLEALVQDLLETVRLPGRAGLAAPQIGVGLRVFSYKVEGREGHVVNPTLTVVEGRQEGQEGCLSIPGIWQDCARAMRAVVVGFDVEGHTIEVEGRGHLARCLQHETDHLDGKLVIDRLARGARNEAMRAIRERALFDSVNRRDDGDPAGHGQATARPSWLSHY